MPWKIWWQLCYQQLQKLLCPMYLRISLLSSLLSTLFGIQWNLQPMFVQQTWRLCHHSTMETSHHLLLSRQMPWTWTRLQWKHCRPTQWPTIHCLLARSYCWMYCLSRKLEIQRVRKCLSFRRRVPHRTNPKTLIFLY